ncbi:hypothetical protein [Paenisporosarcina sp. NPDC076898]|uniref:hypothetical protein n=1 Tax=unclassified Paenisporosarcina TaxID=2642018 RepID=UPI003D01D4E9
MKKMIVILLFSFLLCACNEQGQKNSNVDGYKKSEINEEIPVPANAVASELNFNNPNINNGIKYNLENIGGEQGLYPPLNYFEEMKKWGWEEVENERAGHAHFFRKGDTVISIIVKEDYFKLYEMKETFEFN